MTTKKAWQPVLGMSIAVVLLWLTLRNIDSREMQRAFAGAKPGYIVLAFAAVIIGYSCRVQRWRLMLLYANPGLGWSECAGPFLASFAANNVLPFRAGDVMRAFAFNARLGTTSGIVVATIILERMLDLLVILGAFGAALAVFGIDSVHLVGAGGLLCLSIAAAVALAVLRPRVLIPVMQALARFAGRTAPSLNHAISGEMTKGAAAFEHLAGPGRLPLLVLWSLLAWLMEGCAFWLAALAVPSLLVPVGGWLALPLSALATLVPSTPGYVGTFDYFTALAMKTVGNEITSATVYALLIHVIVWLPSTIGGGAYLLMRFVGVNAYGRP